MLRPLGTVALGLLVAAGAAAQESAAPLAGSKKELQELRERQKATDAPELKGGLRSAAPIPSLGPGVGGVEPPLPRLTPENLEKERKQREKARQNWLVNGVNRLKSEADDPGGRTRGTDLPTDAEDEVTPESANEIDHSDPAYLLKLYDRQKQLGAGKTVGSAGKGSSSPPTDPLAPFLQGWLANSPVRDQALAGARQSSANALTGGFRTEPTAGTRLPGEIPVSGGLGARPTTEPNPYLADLAPPPAVLTLRAPEPFAAPAAAPLATLPAAGKQGPAATLTPALEPVPDSRRVAPPPTNDDKKYFPQLKKF